MNSVTEFDRKFLKRNRISFQKCKLKYYQRNEEQKQLCRLIFIDRLLKLLESNENIYFFDETTFEINSKGFHCYGFAGQRPETQVKMKPIYLRLLLIVSFTKIEAGVFSQRPVNSDYVFDFLRRFTYTLQYKKDYLSKSVILILDNAPKNRTQNIKSLSEDGYINLMYTVPCSPFTNFIESTFNKIKRTIQRHNLYPFKYY